ncbi:MAG: fatty acid desaturase family protein [Firmicutes bacterium]|nr:fatty acid desaturase family protein [Bacillota bacterium]
MSELHSIGWYSSQITPRLPKQVFKPVPQRLWGGLVYMLLTIAGIWAIAAHQFSPWVNLAIALGLGQTMAGLGFLGHEVLHGTVVKTAWLRDLIGCICFAQFNLGAKLWRKWHNMEHHAHTQDEDTDPDAWATMEKLYKRPLLRWIYKLPPGFRAFFNFASFSLFFSIHSSLMFKRYIGEFKPRDRAMVWMQLLVPWAIWLSLLALIGPGKWLFAYVIPVMIANALVIGYISTNHQLNPLTPVNDPLANSLSVTVPRWVDMLHFNFSYHTEHHLYPGVNAKYGPMIKAVVKEMWPEQYFELPLLQALKALWKTPRIYHNYTDLVDPGNGHVFGSLGHGLDAEQFAYRQIDVPKQGPAPMGLGTLEQSPAQGD